MPTTDFPAFDFYKLRKYKRAIRKRNYSDIIVNSISDFFNSNCFNLTIILTKFTRARTAILRWGGTGGLYSIAFMQQLELMNSVLNIK